MSQEDSILFSSLVQNCRIFHAVKALGMQMRSFMPKTLQEGYTLRRNAHVRQESHVTAGFGACTVSSASHAAYCNA